MASTVVTVRLGSEIKARLQELADATKRANSFLITEAISEYLKVQAWQINEIKKGIAEADSGQLIAHDKVVKYWKGKHAR